MQFYGNYFSIGTTKNAVKVFSEMLKLHKDHKIDQQLVRDRISLWNYDAIFIWSRSAKRFFCEIWIWDIQIWSFHYRFNNHHINQQSYYFAKKIPEKKEMFEKIIALYPMLDQNAMTNKNT